MQAANAYFCAGASHHLVLHRYKLWLLADADLLSTRNSYRLCNTGCVATRALLVSCPLVDVSVGHPWCRPAAPAATPARLSADAPSGRMVRSAGCGVAPERGCAQLGGTSEVDAVHEQTARQTRTYCIDCMSSTGGCTENHVAHAVARDDLSELCAVLS